jgi:hypothetical protein
MVVPLYEGTDIYTSLQLHSDGFPRSPLHELLSCAFGLEEKVIRPRYQASEEFIDVLTIMPWFVKLKPRA